MHTYILKIRPQFIKVIENGDKKREYRLNDESRKAINIGDRLVLLANDNSGNYVEVRVKSKKRFENRDTALKSFWKEDFANMYTQIEDVLHLCNKFYTKDEIKKYGIVVFFIEPIKVSFKNAKILLDTNIIISRESVTSFDANVMDALKSINNNDSIFCTCDEIKKEIEKYSVPEIKDSMLTKIEHSYTFIGNNDFVPDRVFKKFLMSNSICNANTSIDNSLLGYLYNGKCDLFITNDTGIKYRSKQLFLDKRVLSIPEILSKLGQDNLVIKHYVHSNIVLSKFKDISVNDSFFDSLKEDYGKDAFSKRFLKKSDEPCYILRKNNEVKAFLYLKKENENEDYGDFEKPFSKKVRLKIGTFKIALSNLRLGERFIQIIIENAITNNIDEIYVTLFENDRSEINALKGLLTTWGFNFYTKKKSNGESIFVKNIGPYNENITLKENYPAIPCDKQYRFLPIFPEYHFRMFPDLVLKSEKNIPMCEIAVENALEKIYITREYPYNKAKAGDLLVIYRIGESDRNKNYSSCATGIAIFEKREEAKAETDFFKLCKNKTVFSDYELQNFYKKGYKYLIYMIYLRPLMHNVILEKLREKKILGYNEGPRILTPISREHYNEIIELSEV